MTHMTFWPDNARLAMSFVVNVGKGAEPSVADGGKVPEAVQRPAPSDLPRVAARVSAIRLCSRGAKRQSQREPFRPWSFGLQISD